MTSSPDNDVMLLCAFLRRQRSVYEPIQMLLIIIIKDYDLQKKIHCPLKCDGVRTARYMDQNGTGPLIFEKFHISEVMGVSNLSILESLTHTL